jgi:phage shock protein C
MTTEKLVRSNDKIIAGVCAGIGDYLGWKRDRVRIATVIIALITALFPVAIAYIFLWFLMPAAGDDGSKYPTP